MQNASVKRKLAEDSNNTDLAMKATMELIGHLSKENKGPYLRDTAPLEKYIDAKDEFDYKHNNYTTTEFLDATPDEKVRNLQRQLNQSGYTDKFGEPLKEDGILGAKTLYAKDNYKADTGYRSNARNARYNITALSNSTENTSQRFGNRTNLPVRTGIRPEIGETYQNNTKLENIRLKDATIKPKGYLSEGDEQYSESKQKLIKCASFSWYNNSGNDTVQNKIHGQTQRLRWFDEDNIEKAYLLNNSSGAMKMGHNAIMLVDKDGKGVFLVFSHPAKTLLILLQN